MRPHTVDPRVLLVLLVTVLGALTWLTRHPDSELVRRAEDLPLVGSWASKLKAAYSPLRIPGEVEDGDRANEAPTQTRIEIIEVSPEWANARPQVWLEAGTRVRAAPAPDSSETATIELFGNYSVIESRGDWYRISRYFADGRVIQGWVLLEGYEEPTADRLRRPAPVLPLAAVASDPSDLRRARSLMSRGGVEGRCGPYSLHTDQAAAVRDLCGPLVGELEEVYRQRFGLTPVGEPAEAILMFGSRDAYRAFVAEDGRIPADKSGHAVPARGYVALYTEDQPVEAVASTLVHELTHLINRRALGPALPPWLSEGLADDLAESRIGDSGRLIPGVLGGFSVASDGYVRHFGGLVSVRRLAEVLDGEGLPNLRQLVQMDWDEFHAGSEATLLYALSSSWVRFLLSDALGSDPAGFRSFLSAVSEGESLDPGLLEQHLDSDWELLEARFRAWLRFQAAPLSSLAAVESQ